MPRPFWVEGALFPLKSVAIAAEMAILTRTITSLHTVMWKQGRVAAKVSPQGRSDNGGGKPHLDIAPYGAVRRGYARLDRA